MDAKSYGKWQKVADEFLNSELNETDFCKAKKLDVEVFRHRLREVESYEKQENVGALEDNSFVELIPQTEESHAIDMTSSLQIQFHGAVFELEPGFPVDVFRDALRVVKEVV